MCYITESAIDHDNDRVGRLTCENCQGDYNKLIEIEYCLAAEANEWDGTDSKGEPQYHTMDVCEDCKDIMKRNAKYIVA